MPVLLFVEVRNTSNILTFDFSGILSHLSALNTKTIQTTTKVFKTRYGLILRKSTEKYEKIWVYLGKNGTKFGGKWREMAGKLRVQTLIQ